MNSTRTRTITTVLEEGHGLVRRALRLLAGYAGQVASGLTYDPRFAKSFVHFFRAYVEGMQREQEAGLLFPWLTRQGLPEECGPLVVLRTEHEVSRELLQDLQDAAHALVRSPGDMERRVAFHGRALRLVEHHLAHLDREDHVILPLARRLAAGGGVAPDAACPEPVHEREWIEALENHETCDWPETALTRQGLGTTEAFEQLCATSFGRPCE